MVKQKTMMVDLDDTIVSFSEMFINRLNSIMSSGKFAVENKRFTIEDFQSYEIIDLFKQFNQYQYINYQYMYEQVCNEVFSDISFYKNPIFTLELPEIRKIICSNLNEYNIILNTKVSSLEMMMSKANLFKDYLLFNLFDEIIVDYEKGSHTPKNTHYDIMIDDAPHNIENYLNKNDNGIVFMPLRPWNDHLKNHPRVNILKK